MIRKLTTTAAVLAMMAGAAAADVRIADVAELSGAGAAAGAVWHDGVKMAVEEINAAGGILGEQIDFVEYDSQTDPQNSRAMVQKAIDEGAYVLMGTVYSSSTVVNMLVAQQNGVPQFVGAEAPGAQRSGGLELDGGGRDKPSDAIATLQIELADFDKRRRASEIFQEIRDRTANIAGIHIEVHKTEGGPPTGKDVRLEVKSEDYNTLVGVVGQVRDHFDTLSDIQDLEDGRPLPGIEWEIDLNREEAGRYNAGVAAVGSMVQLVTNGLLMGK